MGQLSVACCQFTSDTPLSGQVVKFNPALFISNPTQSPSNNIQNQWVAAYPSIGSTDDFNWTGSAVNQNWQATIEAIDDFNFIVCLEFFWLSDMNGYTSDASYNNYQIFNNVIGNGTSVYQQQQFLAMYVDVNGETANCFQPAEGNQFCQDNVQFTLGELDGFCPNEDLEIGICFPDIGSGIGSTYYVGFIQTNSITNALPFVDDFNLNYGIVNNGISQVDTIGQNDLDISCFASAGKGFFSNGIKTRSKVTISGSCLVANSKYKLYVVYKYNGEWRSCISQPICQKLNEGYPNVSEIGSCCVTDSLGNEYQDCCVRGLASCGTSKICIKLPRSQFEAALADKGYTGILEDYFVSGFMSQSNSDPSINGVGGSGGLNVTPTITADGIEICTSYSSSNIETIFFTGCFRFNYGDSLNPLFQNIYIISEVGFTGQNIPAMPTFALNGDDIESSYCCEDGGTLSVDFGETGCTGFLSNGGSTYSEFGDISSIPTDILDCGTDYCVKAICSDGTTTDPNDCDCPPCADVTLEFIQDTCGETTNDISGVFSGTVLNDVSIIWSEVIGGNVVTQGTLSFNGNTFTGTIPISNPNANTSTFSYLIQADTAEGCEYFINTGQITGNSQDVPPCDILNNYNLIKLTENETGCECDEECEDENTGYVEYECDPENGITLCQSVVSLQSPVDTDTGDQKTEDLDDNGNVIKCYITREITFTNGCEPLHIEDVIECINNDPCVNSRTIEFSVSEDCKLEINFTDSFDSDILGDTLNIFINGNQTTYDQLNIPYANDLYICHGDSTQINTKTVFNDGCIDLDRQLTFQLNEDQRNERIIECEVVNGFIEISYTDTFLDTAISDILYIELNGSLNTYDPLSSYTSNLAANQGDEICVWSETEFERCCTPPLKIDKVCKNVEVEPSDCDYSGFGVECSYTKGVINENGTCELGQFDVSTTDGSATLIKDITVWCFNDKPFVYGSDGNVIQNGIPYLKPVIGDGQFYVGRCIQIQGCDPLVLWDYCSSIPLSNVNIKGANLDLSDIPPIEIKGYVKTIDCTDSVSSGDDTTISKP